MNGPLPRIRQMEIYTQIIRLLDEAYGFESINQEQEQYVIDRFAAEYGEKISHLEKVSNEMFSLFSEKKK